VKNKMSDLRNHLFEAIEALRDEEKAIPMEVARAKAISDLAQTIINSAKVEIEFANVLGVRIAQPFFDNAVPDDGKPWAAFALSSEVRKSA
jgi:hypothetical protein